MTGRSPRPGLPLPQLPITASILRAQIKAAIGQWEDESAVCGYGLDEAVMRVVQPVLEMAWGINRGEIEGLAVVSLEDLRALLGDVLVVTETGRVAYGRLRAVAEMTG